MINNILKLEGVRALNKKQLRNINGGSGTCQYYNSFLGTKTTGLSRQEAEDRLKHKCDRYCCDSCATASWASAPTSGQAYTIGVPGYVNVPAFYTACTGH